MVPALRRPQRSAWPGYWARTRWACPPCPETIVARHCGLRVFGVSCITNMAAGILDQPLNHEEVMETAERVKYTFRGLLDRVIAAM